MEQDPAHEPLESISARNFNENGSPGALPKQIMMQSKLPLAFDEKKIDTIFAGIDQCYLPGAVVGIVIDGEPVYRKGFGLANIELPVVLSPSSRMRIHSMTKHLACRAYMLLCEEGNAGIDDPLEKYLPELHPVTRKSFTCTLSGFAGVERI